jgi:hypothetical protein
MTKYEEMTIESAKYGTGVTVYGYGTYGSTSVLAGQTKKQYLEGFDTLEQAKKAYPTAHVGGGYQPHNDIGSTPANWFDPTDAGETWDSDY